MEELEKRAARVPWLWVIALAVIVSFFGAIWGLLIPYALACTYSLGTVEWMEITLAPFMGMIILGALTRIKSLREKMDFTKITYLYTVLMVTSYFVCPGGFPIYTFGRVMFSVVKYPELAHIAFPSFMVPSTELANQIVTGGIPVPWGDWLPVIIFWWVETCLFSIFLVCAANIFRRQWIDVERVTFPVTVAAIQITNNISSGGVGEHKGRYRMFTLGIILGLVLQLPIGLAVLFPWFPDIFGWRTNTCSVGFGYVTAGSPLSVIIGLTGFRKTPASYFIGYLIPLKILFNSWFWYLVYLILAQVFFVMGYYTGITERSGCGRVWCFPNPSRSLPIETEVVSMGGGIMLVVMMFYLSRSYVIETLRAAIGKLPTTRIQEMEKNEAMSYRMNYLAIVASFLLIIGILLVSGMSPLTSILTPISAFVGWFSTLRVYGSTGMQMGSDIRGWIVPRLIWGDWGQGGPVPFTRDFGLTNYLIKSPGADQPSMGWAGGMMSCYAGYRMASETGASNKSVFRVAVCSIVIAPVLAIIAYLSMTYTYGASSLPMGNMIQSAAMDQYVLKPSQYAPGEGDWGLPLLFGMLMVGILSYMHARFIWFPFEPIGFIIGWSAAATVLFSYWSSFLVAWVVKSITLRVGGSKVYEEYGVPIAVGGVAGCVLGIFIVGLMYNLRFFVPF